MLPGQELSIDLILKLLRRHRWLLIGPLFVGVLGGLLYSRSQPSLYRSDAVIQVVPQRVPESYVSATVTERVEDRLRALAQQVLSRTQLEKLITEFNLFPEERQKMPLEDVVVLMQTKRVLIRRWPPRRRRGASRSPKRSACRSTTRTRASRRRSWSAWRASSSIRTRGSAARRPTRPARSSKRRWPMPARAWRRRRRSSRTSGGENAGRLPTQMQTNMQAIQNTQLALQAMVESLARARDCKLVLDRLYTDAVADAEAGVPAAGPTSPTATPRQRLEAARTRCWLRWRRA